MAELVIGRRPAGKKRRRTRSGNAVMRLVLAAGVALIVIAAAEAVLQFALADRFAVTEIAVRSDLAISRDRLLEIAGVQEGVSYFDLDLARIEERVAALPEVRSVAAEKSFPNRVSLTVEARTPLAVAFGELGGSLTPLVIDADGVVFDRSAARADWDLPIVSGLRFEGERLGARMPERVRPFLESLGTLQEEAPQVLNEFSEFRLSGTGGGIEVLAYPTSFRTPVRLGDQITEDLLKYAIMVLELIHEDESIGSDVVELDFRTGQAVLRSVQE